MLFGIVWLLVLGLAYRRHVERSFWTRPPALVFYITFLPAALWHAPRAIDTLLERFAPPAPAGAMSADPWWPERSTRTPAVRQGTDQPTPPPLDLDAARPPHTTARAPPS